MTMMRLNSQVNQYDGSTPGKGVFGRSPKLPIRTADNAHFRDFANRSGSAVKNTRRVREIEKNPKSVALEYKMGNGIYAIS